MQHCSYGKSKQLAKNAVAHIFDYTNVKVFVDESWEMKGRCNTVHVVKEKTAVVHIFNLTRVKVLVNLSTRKEDATLFR